MKLRWRHFWSSPRLALAFLLLAPWFSFTATAEKIAYFYALDADLVALQKEGVAIGVPKTIAGQLVATIQIGTHQVYAVKMGSGCIQTSIAAATILSRFPCDLAISTGPAGRLTDQILIGEWMRVSEVVAYQVGSETGAGFVLGQKATRKLEDKAGVKMPSILAKCPWYRLASGELFIASNTFRERLHATTQAICVDMNLAGLTAACSEAKVPLLAFKVISDSADDSASKDFQAFVKRYDGTGGQYTAAIIKALPPNLNDPATHSNLKSLLNSAE